MHRNKEEKTNNPIEKNGLAIQTVEQKRWKQLLSVMECTTLPILAKIQVWQQSLLANLWGIRYSQKLLVEIKKVEPYGGEFGKIQWNYLCIYPLSWQSSNLSQRYTWKTMKKYFLKAIHDSAISSERLQQPK